MDAYGIFNIYQKKNDIFEDDIEFMVRMIIGCRYELAYADSYNAIKFHLKEGEEDSKEEWKIELQTMIFLNLMTLRSLPFLITMFNYFGYLHNGHSVQITYRVSN